MATVDVTTNDSVCILGQFIMHLLFILPSRPSLPFSTSHANVSVISLKSTPTETFLCSRDGQWSPIIHHGSVKLLSIFVTFDMPVVLNAKLLWHDPESRPAT